MTADHLKTELDQRLTQKLIIAGPAPAPLARAESNFRYQIMIRTSNMPRLSRDLAKIFINFKLPSKVFLSLDIDPANLS